MRDLTVGLALTALALALMYTADKWAERAEKDTAPTEDESDWLTGETNTPTNRAANNRTNHEQTKPPFQKGTGYQKGKRTK